MKTTSCTDDLSKGAVAFDNLSADLVVSCTSLHEVLAESSSRQTEGFEETLDTVSNFVTKQIKKDLPTGSKFYTLPNVHHILKFFIIIERYYCHKYKIRN